MDAWIGVAAILVGLASCFYGYPLFRIVLILAGLIYGYLLSQAFTPASQPWLALLIGVGAAVVMALLAYPLWSLGVIVIGAALGFMILGALGQALNLSPGAVILMGVLGAAVVGFLFSSVRDLFVMLATAFSGATQVVYGLVGIQAHAKMCVVVRNEEGSLRHYVHLSTGNYNVDAARVYTDIDLLTANEDFGREAARLMNVLTGFSSAGLAHVLERGSGRIVFIASLLSFQGGILVPGYSASKGGVVQLMMALSNEWAGRGVTVNAVAPGISGAAMTAAMAPAGRTSRQSRATDAIPASACGRWRAQPS